MPATDRKIFFSVIIPTFNMLFFLKKAIKSVINQKFKNFEIIIIDNCSTDGTRDYLKSLKNKKIKYFKIENKGVIGKSRNLGIKKSKGNWIAFLDADDQWTSNKLFDVSKKINSQNFHVICSSELIIDEITNTRKIWHYGPFKKNFYEFLLRYGNKLSTSSTIVSKNFIKLNDIYFSEKKSFSNFEDYDFFLNISKKEGVFYFLNKVHGKHLFHLDSSTLKRKRLNQAFFSVIKNHVNSQKFTKNKTKLLNDITNFYEIKKIMKNIYYKNDIFYNICKLVIFFIYKPVLACKISRNILQNQKNVIRIS